MEGDATAQPPPSMSPQGARENRAPRSASLQEVETSVTRPSGRRTDLRRKASGCRVRQEKETAMRHSVFLVWCVALTLIGWTSAPAWAADTRLGGHARPSCVSLVKARWSRSAPTR